MRMLGLQGCMRKLCGGWKRFRNLFRAMNAGCVLMLVARYHLANVCACFVPSRPLILADNEPSCLRSNLKGFVVECALAGMLEFADRRAGTASAPRFIHSHRLGHRDCHWHLVCRVASCIGMTNVQADCAAVVHHPCRCSEPPQSRA